MTRFVRLILSCVLNLLPWSGSPGKVAIILGGGDFVSADAQVPIFVSDVGITSSTWCSRLTWLTRCAVTQDRLEDLTFDCCQESEYFPSLIESGQLGANGQVGYWQGRAPILLQRLSNLFGDKRQVTATLITGGGACTNHFHACQA